MNNQNQSNRSFRTVASSGQEHGTPWKPHSTLNNGFHYDANDVNNRMECYLVDVQEGVGQNNSTAYKLREVLSDGSMGDLWSLWGDTVLNDALSKVRVGSFICLEYTGRKHKKNMSGAFTQTNSYHSWNVGVDDNAIPYNELNKIPATTVQQAPPVQQVQQRQQAAPVQQAVAPQQRTAAPAQQQAAPVQQRQSPVSGNSGRTFTPPANNQGIQSGPISEDDLPF